MYGTSSSVSSLMPVSTNLHEKLDLKQSYFDVDVICYPKQQKESHKYGARSLNNSNQ